MGKYTRLLRLRADPPVTFFFWGARQAGKSTLLKAEFPEVPWGRSAAAHDLPGAMLQTPELLIEEQRPAWRRLHRDRRGSEGAGAARCRALADGAPRRPLCALWIERAQGAPRASQPARRARRTARVAWPVGDGDRPGVDLVRLLNHGYLPPIYDAERPLPLLDAYVSQYLKEEIAAEGLARRLPAYADFLAVAALSDGGRGQLHDHRSRHRQSPARRSGAISRFSKIRCLGRFLPRLSQTSEAAGGRGTEVLLRRRSAW